MQYTTKLAAEPVHVWNPVGFDPRDYLPDTLHCHGDCARYFLHRIHYGQVFGQEKEGWVRPKAENLRRFFTDKGFYKRVRDCLINRGAVVSDNQYIVGEKPYGYRLGPELCGMRQHRITIEDPRLAAKIRTKHEDWLKTPEPVHRHLLHNLRRMVIDYPAALEMLLADDFEPANETAIQMLRDGQLFFHVCDYGRVHTNLTNLKSTLRPFLSYQGQPLVNLDIGNSQPLFFSILLKDRYAAGRMPADVELYIELCQTGKFYDHLMAETDIPAEKRGEFKRKFFAHVFFCENWPETDAARSFGAVFPNVYATIRDLKADDYTALAKDLQRAESGLMIGKVAVRVMRELPHAFIGTIHDSILTTPDQAEPMLAIMREEFSRIGLRPKIKVEPLCRPEEPGAGELHCKGRRRRGRKRSSGKGESRHVEQSLESAILINNAPS